jgi:hypothetical protein
MKRTRWPRMAEVVDLNRHRNRPKAAVPTNSAIGLAIRLDLLRGPAEEEIPNLLLSTAAWDANTEKATAGVCPADHRVD